MQGKIAAMETTIRDLETNHANGPVPGASLTRSASASARAPTHASPGVQNSHKRGLSSDGGEVERPPGKRLQGSRNWFPSESDAEDEDSNTHSNQSGEKSRKIWFSMNGMRLEGIDLPTADAEELLGNALGPCTSSPGVSSLNSRRL
jgi:hypothetical protein